MSDILKLWNLRTHPFSPQVDAQGKPFVDPSGAPPKREFWLNPLDPKIDGRFINFYFDFYDWQYSNLIHRISRQAIFEKFPSNSDLKEPKSLLIIIHGYDGMGRESLRNLILHKIRIESGAEPILVEAELASIDHAETVKTIARNFWDAYEDANMKSPTRTDLKEIYEEETKDPPPKGSDSPYQNLFGRMNRKIRKVAPQVPTVLLLQPRYKTGGDIYDTWQAIYNSTHPLFQYIIIVTANPNDAKTCNTQFTANGKNVALIVLRFLKQQDARDYLETRLEQERVGPPPVPSPLAPFTEEALKELFEPGAAVDKKAYSPDFNIAELNRTFICALDYHLCWLQQQDITTLKPEHLLIGRETISEVRRIITSGGKCPTPKDI